MCVLWLFGVCSDARCGLHAARGTGTYSDCLSEVDVLDLSRVDKLVRVEHKRGRLEKQNQKRKGNNQRQSVCVYVCVCMCVCMCVYVCVCVRVCEYKAMKAPLLCACALGSHGFKTK